MARPRSLLPTLTFLACGLVIFGLCVFGLRHWQSRQLATSTEPHPDHTHPTHDTAIRLRHEELAEHGAERRGDSAQFAPRPVAVASDTTAHSPTGHTPESDWAYVAFDETTDGALPPANHAILATPSDAAARAERDYEHSASGSEADRASEPNSVVEPDDGLPLASSDSPAATPPIATESGARLNHNNLDSRRDESAVEDDDPSDAAPDDDESQSWPRATALRTTLTSVTGDAATAWARQVLSALDRLEAASTLVADDARAALGRLKALEAAAAEQLAMHGSSPEQARMMRAHYALQRRLSIWSTIQQAAERPARPEFSAKAARELLEATAAVDRYLAASGRHRQWRSFLMIDELRQAFYDVPDGASRRSASVARCILARLDSKQLTQAQRSFVDQADIRRWTGLLEPLAAEPVEYTALLRAIERYEVEPAVTTARDIARVNQSLRWSSHSELTDIGTQLNLHYRNANVRVAVAAELANRLMPPLRKLDAPVNDVIRNAHVVGHSQTAARTRIVLFPNETSWSLGLDVLGNVASETHGRRGPARFFQDGHARFHARKLVQVDLQGIHTKPAFGVAESSSQLTGVETDFDGIPLMNRLVRSFAQKQYEGEAPAAQSEVDNRISREASRRLDDEVQQLIADAQKRLDTQVLRPLINLGVEPTAIDYETTRTRLITRYRLAGTHQLAAYSPRPQAPSNALLSFQVHESALNNVLEQLRLDGKRSELEPLIREIGTRLGHKEVEIPDDLPEKVQIHFAAEQAVQVRFEEGRVVLTLQIAELSQGRDRHWKHFFVRGYYVPHVQGRQVELVRDGIIELGGDRRRLGDQVALRAIFAKVLSKNRPIKLVPQSVVDRPELAGIEVSQTVIEGGWVGITFAQTGPVARQGSSNRR